MRLTWSMILLFVCVVLLPAQSEDPSTGRAEWEAVQRKPKQWYGTAEAFRIAENLLLYQRSSGGWPKNIEYTKPLSENEREKIIAVQRQVGSTIDNGATYSQIRYLLHCR